MRASILAAVLDPQLTVTQSETREPMGGVSSAGLLGNNFRLVPASSCVHSSANATGDRDLPSPSLSALDLLTWGFSYPVTLPFSEVKMLLSPHFTVQPRLQRQGTVAECLQHGQHGDMVCGWSRRCVTLNGKEWDR